MQHNLKSGLVFGCAAVAVACSQPAMAQQRSFDIAAQDARKAIPQFARQAGVRISAPTGKLKGVMTNAVSGMLDARSALKRLIAGTGLAVASDTGGMIVLRYVSGSRSSLDRQMSLSHAKDRSSASAMASAGAGGTKSASSSGEGDEGSKGEEIVVTAQKREQKLQDVPISVAVVTSEDISRRHLVSGGDYLRGIPGVNQVDQGGGNLQAIVIRGVETSPSGQNFSAGTTVATYFGETPTANSAGLAGGSSVDIKLVDIERVEVLRGPQGTAFGSSSLGGAVRVIPKAPRTDRIEGSAAIGYSHTGGFGGDNYLAQGAINIPLVQDKIAIRAVAYHIADSGYYRNIAATDPTFQSTVAIPSSTQAFANNRGDVGRSSFTGLRMSTLFQPVEEFKLTFSYINQKAKSDDYAIANRPGYRQAVLDVAPEHVIRGERGGVADSRIQIANATMEYDLDWADLIATYSYIDSDSIYSRQFTAEATSVTFPLSQVGSSEHREHNGEVRISTKFDGPLNLLAGVYREKHDDFGNFDYVWYGVPNPFGASRAVGALDDIRTLSQTALFGEMTWDITPELTATGGARYYEYRRTGVVNGRGFLFAGPTLVPTSVATEGMASGTTFRGNLSYKPRENALVYASFAQGFRLGKPQSGLPAGACDTNSDGTVDGTTGITIESTRMVNSDKVNSYELGAKFSFLDRRLNVEADIFRVDWSGVPVRVNAPVAPNGCGISYNANAGEARVEGVEGQINFRLTKQLRFDLGGSYINARLTEDAPAIPAVSGARLPGSPRVNANAALQYEFLVGGREAFIRADAVYIGPFYGNLQESARTRAGDYVKLDLSGRVSFGKLNVDLYVKNLTNENSFSFRGTANPTLVDYGFRMRPRTIGFQLGYDF